MPSHADNHDLDKLRRWQRDLAAAAPDAPAVYAVFLVSQADTAAHNVFRAFRSGFEAHFREPEAGFAHLVIFGQHGISTTVRALQSELGLPEEALPTLALFTGNDALAVIPLSPGAHAAGEPEAAAGWPAALEGAEQALAAPKTDGGKARDKLLHLCKAVAQSLS